MTTPPAPVRVFVAARGNGFMRDIAEWFVDAAGATGRSTELVTDELPSVDGSINLVVAPHEFFELHTASRLDLQRAAAASICVGTEQPGTPWFRLTVDACRRGLVSLDINPQGAAALCAEGIDARHVQLGAVASMTSPSAHSDQADRPVDVLFMGGLDDRRGAALAALAPSLHGRAADIRLFKFDRPVSASTPGLVFGSAKYDVLARAKVLVNIHRDRPGTDAAPHYFEWARMVEAMANRCVVLTEPAATYAPLIDGDHFVTADLDELGAELDRLLDDDNRRTEIADRAHDAVFGPLRLDIALAAQLERIETDVLGRLQEHVATSRPDRGPWHLGLSQAPQPVLLGPFTPYTELRRRAKRLALDDTDMIRRIESVVSTLRTGSPEYRTISVTPGHDQATPRVSSVVTLYNYAGVVGETLDSLAASAEVDHEIIVVDDHSADDGRRVVERFMASHPELAVMLIAKDVNAGLATARNDGFDAARGEYVFVIDADNHVYPTCLRRLADTLDEHPDASAAYSILEDFGDQQNVRSALGWDPARLCAANYIDAQSMWRKSDWFELGGYRNDDRFVFGWEDWDLWLRLAASGGQAVLRREILGRYRVQQGSMIALTNLETADAIAAMQSRYPSLPWV
jgi:hypothetical protein